MERRKPIQKQEIKKETPKKIEVECIRRHLNDEYMRAIEVGEKIVLSYKYAQELKKQNLVK